MSSPIEHQLHRHRKRMLRLHHRHILELKHEIEVFGVPGYDRFRKPPGASLSDRLPRGDGGDE